VSILPYNIRIGGSGISRMKVFAEAPQLMVSVAGKLASVTMSCTYVDFKESQADEFA
jgi:hypothetical protein